MYRYLLSVLLLLTFQIGSYAQTVEERLKALEDRAEKAEGDVTRLREEYDKKLQDAQESIKKMQQQQATDKSELDRLFKKWQDDLLAQQKKFEDAYLPAKVPVGTILPYYGSTTSLPASWRLCNGEMVTGEPQSPFNNKSLPNLNGKFLRGVDIRTGFGTVGSSYRLGDEGGNDEIPSHQHTIYGNVSDIRIPENNVFGGPTNYQVTSEAHNFFADVFSLTTKGNNTGHGHFGGTGNISNGYTNLEESKDNKPKFYSIYYIIRIK